MSWFLRSSRRRRSAAQAEAPPAPPRPSRADLEDRPLADLHALAAEWEVPRFRLLRRGQLIEAISGEEAAEGAAGGRPQAAGGRRQAAEEPGAVMEPETGGEFRSGILDVVGEGYGFLRVQGLFRSPDDPYVDRALVEEHSLRRGQEIGGPVAPRRGRERHPRLSSVAWTPDAAATGWTFDDMPVQRPSRALRPAAGGDFAGRMVELVASLGIGQRALVAGPAGAGATHLLRDLTRALVGGRERLIVALVDVRPEEVPEWDLPETVEVHAAAGDRAPRDQVALAELALERAKRLAERGEDVVLVLDSISRLARAYGLARARPGNDALAPEVPAVEGAKRWFAAARDTGAGSVTLLAAARVDSESPLEALAHEVLVDAAGAVVRLDGELAARGLHPAVDARRSRTLGEEALVADGQRAPLDALRGVMRTLEPAEAWEFAAARVRETASNEQLLAGQAA